VRAFSAKALLRNCGIRIRILALSGETRGNRVRACAHARLCRLQSRNIYVKADTGYESTSIVYPSADTIFPVDRAIFFRTVKVFFYARVYARSAGLSDKPRRYAIAYRARHVEKLSRAKVLRCKCPIFMRARYADTQLQRFVGQILSTQIRGRGRAA